MKRRRLFELAAGAPMAAAGGRGAPRPVLMKAGSQHSISEADLKVMSAFGVKHVCGTLPSRLLDETWSTAALTRLRERVESHGIRLEMIPLPLSSLPIERAEMPNIMLGRSPERDREIDQICEMIRNVSRAGIPAVKYNLSILGVVRSERTPGRGGASLSTFVYEKAKQEPPLTAAGRVTAEMAWERIEYFLQRVVPVAEEYKVRMACHPHDPGMPEPQGFRGVSRVLGSVAGLKKFISIRPSPYHGLNFCQGTVTEILQDPDREIHEVIRYFGERKKIFNVHFRNIKGRYLNFQETLPDDGDVNMLRCLRTYRDVGYDGMLMPDHVPHIEGDTGGRQAFAFSFGYIQALLQILRTEG
ncbi:MAG: mannonate dehydratase [Acidobacteriales bacterium]|nr:mannonate dehydratase [Terriglobales bacterium]